jgi:penicillin-binding protein 2
MPDPRRRPKLPHVLEASSAKPPRSGPRIGRPRRPGLPRGRRLEPYSRADAPYFRSPGFYVRIGGLAVVIGIAIAVLVLRAWSIQVLRGKQYASVAHGQAYRTVNLRGYRGSIVDDKGHLLAGSNAQIVVAADASSLGTLDGHGAWHASASGWKAIRRFARFSGTPARTIVARIERSVIRSPFAPAIVLPHPSVALHTYMQERASRFPGFQVLYEPNRFYPQGALGSEFLGLLGEVSQQELDSKEFEHTRPGEIVGQSGVERVYDSLLNPGFNVARVRVDSMGRIAGPLVVPNPKRLPTLQLTIDTRLQRAAEQAVRDGMAFARAAGHSPTGGSAVVMNPWTGAVYALASVPTFNQAAASKSSSYVESLYRNPAAPALNRAIAGVYPTGSTFKPIIAEAALSAGIITPSTPQLCSGSFDLGGYVFHNVEAGVYSEMSLPTALAESCDTWFYRLGDRIWQSAPAAKGMLIQRWARKLGLGQRTGIDLTGESAGNVPTPSWFLRTQHYPWTEGQTINLSIGQGTLQASPLQMAVAYSALINGGKVVRPHVAAARIENGVRVPFRYKPVRKLRLVDTWAIKQGLYEAAHSPAGTSAAIFGSFPIPVAGKTGTAEAPPGDDHSWYVSWAPYEHPKIVVAVMIEHGGFGAEAAAPAAREIYEAFFHVKAQQ